MSVANLEVVRGMKLPPNHCVLCSNNPADEITGEQLQAIFAPGVDVNWGDSVYICWGCTEIIADLAGRVTVEGFDKLNKKYQDLTEAYNTLVGEHNKAKSLIERIQDGQKAVKEARSTPQKPPAKKKKVKA